MVIRGKDRTKKYNEAVKALRELEQSERMGNHACGEFLSEQTNKALEIQGTKKLIYAIPCVRRLIRKRHLSGAALDDKVCRCLLPGSDHTELWKTKDGKIIYVTQPYGISWGNLKALVKRCEELGLEAEISAHSTYFPGSTILIKAQKAK